MLDIDTLIQDVRQYNVGDSNYSKGTIQPWDVWLAWHLDPWDADIVKRVYRHKKSTPREEDYTKIIHTCLEKIRQIRNENLEKKRDC